MKHQHWHLSRTDFRWVTYTDKTGTARVQVAQIEPYDCDKKKCGPKKV